MSTWPGLLTVEFDAMVIFYAALIAVLIGSTSGRGGLGDCTLHTAVDAPPPTPTTLSGLSVPRTRAAVALGESLALRISCNFEGTSEGRGRFDWENPS